MSVGSVPLEQMQVYLRLACKGMSVSRGGSKRLGLDKGLGLGECEVICEL